MEKEPKMERKESIIDREDIQDFIKRRKIRSEDFHLIEELTFYPTDEIVLSFHNLFNMHHERSGIELNRAIQTARDSSKKEMWETVRCFYRKYDWRASWDLVRLLESLPRT